MILYREDVIGDQNPPRYDLLYATSNNMEDYCVKYALELKLPLLMVDRR